MLNFKSFLLEYLVDYQKEKYKDVKMRPEARKATDHHFGEGNDTVHGHIKLEVPMHDHHDKSEIHRAVEEHIGRPVSHAEYRSGLTTDKYGRQAKIGRMIKDKSLQDKFATDNARQGARSDGETFKTSTHRGIEVAGQTNASPDATHPTGHSWGNLSCKNVDTGLYASKLKDEIEHGTVVHFVHDHSGKEIYRATLHPHHDDHGNTAYAVDSEYGVKHPAFSKSAHATAADLSKNAPVGEYYKNRHVYDDSGREVMHHLGANPDLHHILDHGTNAEREAAAKHPSATEEHLLKAEKDKVIHHAVYSNPNAPRDMVERGLTSKSSSAFYNAVKNPHVDADMIHKSFNGVRETYEKGTLLNHPKASARTLAQGGREMGEYVTATLLGHKNTDSHVLHSLVPHLGRYEQDTKAFMDHPKFDQSHFDAMVKHGVPMENHPKISHMHVDGDHIDTLLAHGPQHLGRSTGVVSHATDLSDEHMSKLLAHPNEDVRSAFAGRSDLLNHHYDALTADHSSHVRQAVASNHVAPQHHLDILASDPSSRVREEVASNPRVGGKTLGKLLGDSDSLVSRRAASNRNIDVSHIPALIKHHPAKAVSHPDFGTKPSHFDAVAKSPDYGAMLSLVRSEKDIPSSAIDHYMNNKKIATLDKMHVLRGHPKVTKDHLMTALSSGDDYGVHKGVLEHPNADKDVYRALTKSPYRDVAEKAQDRYMDSHFGAK